MTKSGIPKLRFKEFTDEWQEKKLGDVFDIFNGYSFSSSNAQGIGARWIKIADVGIHEINSENISYLPKNFLEKYQKFVLKHGDYVVALTRPFLNHQLKIAKINDISENSLLNQRVGKFVTQNILGFIYSMLQRSILTNAIENRIAGSDPPNLSTEDIKTIRLIIPTVAEQEKIAGFLTAVDDKIGKLEEKKKGFEKYKKGLMQAIFSSCHPELDSGSRLRFRKPDGANYSDWEVKKLGEMGKTYNGLTGKSGEDFGEGSPYITYMQIFGGSSIDMSQCRKVKVGEKENQNKVKDGDIFFTTSSETPEEVGFSSALLNNNGIAYLNSFCFGYRIEDNAKYLPEYLNLFFRSEGFRKKVIRLAQGSTRFNLSKMEMMKINVQIPTTEEQEKIAEFLTSLDKKVNLINKELEQAKLFKKSLLQQMFV